MADSIIGGGNAGLQALIQNAQNNQAQQSAAQGADDGSSEALQARLLKQMQAKQQIAKDHISHDRSHQQLRKAAIEKRLGAGVAEWAGSEVLQKKLTDRQKQMFLAQASEPATKERANEAGHALNALSDAKNFNQAAPNARAAGELQATLLSNPSSHKSLKQAIDSRFMGDKGGDAAAKQSFLRFASRFGDSRGVSVRMGGDMLGTLSGAQVPGFAQRAAVKMMERNPDNTRGVENVDQFAQTPEVRGMPSMARGRATEVLARADGTDEVREGFEEVASDSQFKSLGGADKARFFATLGQGRASELRAITDQTLVALRTQNFPTQSAQVSRFLTGLSKQISKSGGTAKEVDGKALLRQAKKGTMPALPQLVSTVDNDDEEAQGQARSFNRAALMRYYSQVNEHYDGIENQIKNAKYFEDVNLLTSLRPAKAPDTSALNVSDAVGAEYNGIMNKLNGDLEAREIKRPDYVAQVKTLQIQALGRASLSADEKTWVGSITSAALAGQTYLELAGKKNRKLREVGKNFMPPAKRRRLGQERRNAGIQPRYFKPDDAQPGQTVARVTALPVPQGREGAAQTNDKIRSGDTQVALEMMSQRLQRLEAALLGGGAASAGRGSARPGSNADLRSTMEGLGQRLQKQEGAQAASARTIKGKEDAWGIPRTFERDLGSAAGVVPVRAAAGQTGASEEREVAASESAPVQVVRSTASLRDLGTMYGLPWKELSRDESNVLRNLGWDHATWDAKGQPGARWPVSLRTTYASLSPKQRASVQALRFSADAWDTYVEGVTR